MSSLPANPDHEPFVPTTTFNIQRANRLIALKAHPGFLDFLNLSQEVVGTATAQLVDFEGWDKDQITVLKVRAQAAKEHHALIIAKLLEAIQLGIDEAKSLSSVLPPQTVDEAVDQGDYVRQRVLQHFEERESRAAGSY